ncbi:MAG: DUF1844 domain-containing protein [Pseudomonadota bacterium]
MSTDKGFILKEECSCESPGSKCCMPGITFSTFIVSLYSSALVQLGEMADPATGKIDKNLPLAKQTIELIDMLQKKTRGNLDTEEENLTQSLLHEIRLAYVKAKG